MSPLFLRFNASTVVRTARQRTRGIDKRCDRSRKRSSLPNPVQIRRLLDASSRAATKKHSSEVFTQPTRAPDALMIGASCFSSARRKAAVSLAFFQNAVAP
jgi:hypothetical protein